MVRKKINMLLVVGMAVSSVAPVVAAPTKERVSRGAAQAEKKEEFQGSFQTRWERIAKGPQTLYNAWQKQNLEEAAEGLVGCVAYALGLYATYRFGASFMGGASDKSKPANPANPADTTNPANNVNPADATKPADAAKPADQPNPGNNVNPADVPVVPAGGNVNPAVVPAAPAGGNVNPAVVPVAPAAPVDPAGGNAPEVPADQDELNAQVRAAEHRQTCDDIVAMLQATERYEQQRLEDAAAEQRRHAEAVPSYARGAMNSVVNGLDTAYNSNLGDAACAVGRLAKNSAGYVKNRTINGGAYARNEGLPTLRRWATGAAVGAYDKAATVCDSVVHTSPQQAVRATIAGLGYAGNKAVDGGRWVADTRAVHATGAAVRATANGARDLAVSALAYGVLVPTMLIAHGVRGAGILGLAATEVGFAAGARKAASMWQAGVDTYRNYRPGVPAQVGQDAGQADVVNADVFVPEPGSWLENELDLCHINAEPDFEVPARADLSAEENWALRTRGNALAAADNDVVATGVHHAELREVVAPVERPRNVEAGVVDQELYDDVDGDEDVAGPAPRGDAAPNERQVIEEGAVSYGCFDVGYWITALGLSLTLQHWVTSKCAIENLPEQAIQDAVARSVAAVGLPRLMVANATMGAAAGANTSAVAAVDMYPAAVTDVASLSPVMNTNVTASNNHTTGVDSLDALGYCPANWSDACNVSNASNVSNVNDGGNIGL